uniref:Light-harvesting protein n=1 Tax=Nannochloropsis gaditana (strain CCMP526) TaxID=1093141 RepID=I2CR44_NANGC
MAPAPRVSSRSALRMGLEGQVGYDVETGGKPWDPLGFAGISERNNLGINPHIKWLQESEIKHGRTAMLAFLGVIVPGSLGVYVPTYPQEPDFTQAFYKALQNNPLGMAQIALAIAIIEGHYYAGDFWTGGGDREVGAFGFDPLGFSKGKSEAALKSMRLKELKNGRLAMIAMAAFASEKLIPGSVPLLHSAFPTLPI